MPHFYQFYLDFKKNEDRYNIKTAVENLKIPFLVIHGDNDNSVLPHEGNNLHSWNKNSEAYCYQKRKSYFFFKTSMGIEKTSKRIKRGN